jgi:hypothetical protein
MTPSALDAVKLLMVFAPIVAATLAVPLGSLGWRIFFASLCFSVLLLWFARVRRPEWRPMVSLLFPLSVFQILPDYFLSSVLKVLAFDETGGLRVGTVPVFMGLLWTVPLFFVLLIAQQVAEHWRSQSAGLWTATVVALIVFTATEATLWAVPIWHAQQVRQVAHVALYVPPAEAILGGASWVALGQVTRGQVHPVVAAAVVALLYTGALACSFTLMPA